MLLLYITYVKQKNMKFQDSEVSIGTITLQLLSSHSDVTIPWSSHLQYMGQSLGPQAPNIPYLNSSAHIKCLGVTIDQNGNNSFFY